MQLSLSASPAPLATSRQLMLLAGAVVSGGGELSKSAKSSTVRLPVVLSPMPIEMPVAPAGTAGVTQAAFVQVVALGTVVCAQ
jgi:hypothetical protein